MTIEKYIGRKKRPFAQSFPGESKVQRHFKDSCDVNNIVAHFLQTGIDPHADRLKNQKFGYASSQTFEEAMRNIAEINSSFAELSAEVRQEHLNDPARWIDAMASPTPPDENIVDPEAPQEPSPTPPEAPPEDAKINELRDN